MDSLSVGSAVFIVRDSNGSFVDRDAVSFPSSSLFFSEAKAVCLGVNWALSSGAGSCVVESDCRRLIEAILDLGLELI